ncbi:phosphoribosylaminoimidazolesuccinocarboxamide synthase [Stenotrophobium rhamnosiphilum]|uniref:Phosphoribosylaminoimidazole-succinocarboxamide synthase n=1 Tax=Stenotrophobium rhamnosiphilum TaxID=2029166 RepID=A0A2T5MJ54_9GAMM|nr:phosphoribosylaminoimidazolesuccinocarboxamide synthase [Stenotrophobium rhamnosiphilum]PTU32611.1 phosphoribosylaminoimidazolesuccinocarboxamide synthase [Stenotrophobium rhamnosiphilum]
MTSSALLESTISSLPRIHRGKVRDIYALGDDHMLIVTSDRISAFDVIMPRPIPGKGAVLNAVTDFWMKKFSSLIPNHSSNVRLADYLTREELAQCEGRAVVVKRLKAIPVECVARGYLIGSGWKDYQKTGAVCGIPLPAGLQIADKLPEPIFTPADKAPVGQHDENISFTEVENKVGKELAAQLRDITLRIYKEASEYARERGIIIADTKFEFGLDKDGTLHLIDEVLTPDSSRFWPADTYRPGISPPSFDKQIVRDYLETLDWDKKAPGPWLPDEVVEKTAANYAKAQRLLTT